MGLNPPDHDAQRRQNARILILSESRLRGEKARSRKQRTRIWYRKYWMNCFSNGREVSNRWRSVPRSSVTKYLEPIVGNLSLRPVKDAYRSSSGEMKTSLRLIICQSKCEQDDSSGVVMEGVHTFSCWMCFNSFSSRYVRFANTGVLKGFIIFFTATATPVS